MSRPDFKIYEMGSFAKKLNSALHLWLGLLSGIVVFIVCITGCMYAFKDELTDLSQPWRFIEARDTTLLEPLALLEIAEKETGLAASSASALTYGLPDEAVKLDYSSRQSSNEVFINPYSGDVIKVAAGKGRDSFSFFPWVLTGHRTLWLPRHIGKPIVGFGILIFLITLITGMVLWWPRRWNRKTVKNNFTINFKSPWHRINWNLHNVLGGYAFIILTVCSLTGLIWSFGWFSKSVYYVTSGGKQELPYRMPQSDTTKVDQAMPFALDSLYRLVRAEAPEAASFYFALPRQGNKKAIYRVSVEHRRHSYYRTDNLFYDQYTLEPLKGQGPYAGRYKDQKGGDKLRKMNLELHDGRILGLPGKIMAFTGSLIGASLPVTGFIIWLRRKRNGRKKKHMESK